MRHLVAVAMAFGLVAAACSDKKDDDAAPATSAGSTDTTPATGGTAPAGGGTTLPADTVPETAPVPETVPADVEVTIGGTLRVSGDAEVSNPWTPKDMQCDSYCYQRALTFFEPVAAPGADDEIHPYLAQSITPNDDFTQWTIAVRPGIAFTDGTPLDADAVIQNLQTTGTGLLVSAIILDVAKNPDGSLMIDKVDDMTLTIHTGEGGDPSKPLPWPGFPAILATQWGLIASPAWLDAVEAGTAEATAPIGTGPFLVQSYAPRDRMVVDRNPAYWRQDAAGRQLPYLDRIEFRVIEEPEIAAEALRSGEIDVFSTSNGTVVADMRDEAEEFPMIEQGEFTETDFYLMDLTKVPFDDQRVRCALSKAIDRQEIVDSYGGGIRPLANSVFSPGREGYLDDNGFDITQDIAGATALIEEYETETGTQVEIRYGTTNSTSNNQRAELLEGYWTEIGADFEYVQVPQDSFITNALFGVPEFHIYGWRQYAGPTVDPLNHWWNSRGAHPDGELSLNFPRLVDPEVDALLATIRSTTDDDERISASEALNRRFAEQCYFVPESYTVWGTPHRAALRGLGQASLPEQSMVALDGYAFPGNFWTAELWIDPAA